jgi:dihydrodipicolinate synthase/N-acetylneuraminate lyase
MGLPAGNVRLPLGALSEANVEKLRAVLKGLGMVG